MIISLGLFIDILKTKEGKKVSNVLRICSGSFPLVCLFLRSDLGKIQVAHRVSRQNEREKEKHIIVIVTAPWPNLNESTCTTIFPPEKLHASVLLLANRRKIEIDFKCAGLVLQQVVSAGSAKANLLCPPEKYGTESDHQLVAIGFWRHRRGLSSFAKVCSRIYS